MKHSLVQHNSEHGPTICDCSMVKNVGAIGDRTKVWHFANIMHNVIIGDDCMIGSYVQIDPGTRIGNRVRIQPFSAITGIIKDDVFIGPHVTMIDARYPPGKLKDGNPIIVQKGAVIGAHAIIMGEVRENAVVAAGAIVRDFAPSNYVTAGPRDIYDRATYDRKRKVLNE